MISHQCRVGASLGWSELVWHRALGGTSVNLACLCMAREPDVGRAEKRGCNP